MNINIKTFIGIMGIWTGFLVFAIGNIFPDFPDTLQAIFYGVGILISFASSLYIGYVVSLVKEEPEKPKQNT